MSDIQAFFEEEQRVEDEQKRQNVAEEGQKARQKFNSADIPMMIHAEEGEVLDWFYSTLPPQNTQIEVNPYGWDGTHKGGGSKSRRKKDKKGNKAYVDPWTDI